jgi:two-component system cell cycle response regulator DivK
MKTVLLVEDVEDNRELARLLLETQGHTVIDALDGQMAVEMALKFRPDLVLMDLSLPGVDGWEATRRLRADPRTALMPIIALTAHAMSGDRERVLASGFDGYIPKPIDVSSFMASLARYLEPGEGKSVRNADGPLFPAL